MLSSFRLNIKNNIRFNQVVKLLSWNFLGIPLGIVTNIIVTKFLGPKVYGDYMFVNNIFTIAILILNFGIFQAANRALVLTNDTEKAREYYGSELIIMGGIYILMSISLYIYAAFDPNISEKGIKIELFYLIPFSWIYLLIQYFEVLFQADNKIDLLVKTRYFPKVGFFVSAILIYLFFKNFTGNKLFIIWGFYITTQIVVYFFVIKKIKVSLKNSRKRIREIWEHNKSFGFNVYLGSLFSNVFSQLSGLLISYFAIDNSGVGFYTLALTLVSPLSLIPNVIATTHYKDFSTLNSIPKKLVKITFLISITALFFLLLIIPFFIHYFYSKEFEVVIKLSFIVSVGVMFYGISDFFNRFLGAHGNGKALRNSSILVGITILISNIIFIPLFHETGAALTFLLAGLVYFLSIQFYYRKMVKESSIKI